MVRLPLYEIIRKGAVGSTGSGSQSDRRDTHIPIESAGARLMCVSPIAPSLGQE